MKFSTKASINIDVISIKDINVHNPKKHRKLLNILLLP